MLPDAIKAIRRKNYLNQTAFANRIGVTQGAVSQWECGLTRPSTDQLKTISMEFGVSIDDLLAGEPHGTTETPFTAEAKLISNAVDKMTQNDREKALNMMKAVYSDYFDQSEEKNA